jgi:hypothetical protein
MAKTMAVGLTVAAVFAVAHIEVNRGERGAQASAIGALRAISSGQSTYAAVNGGYARSLTTLGRGCPTAASGFISPDLGNDPTVRSGYEFRLYPAPPTAPHVDCHGQPTAGAYYVTAVPVERSGGGGYAFAVDQNQVIWYDVTGIAPMPPFHETRTLRQLGSVSPPR